MNFKAWKAILDFVGSEASVGFGRRCLRRGGRIILVGLFGGWAKDKIRTGLEYIRLDAGSNSYVMLANYLNYSLSDRWDVFMRNDRVETVETSNTETNTYLGAIWKAHENFHIAPSVNMTNDTNDFKVSCMFKY